MRFIIIFLIVFLFLPQIVFAAGWGQLNSPTTNTLLATDNYSSTLFAVGNVGTVLYSSNKGLTWSAGTSNTSYNLSDVAAISDTKAVAVGAHSTIIRTTDGGKNWSVISPTLNTSAESSYGLRAVTMASSTIGFVVGEYGLTLKTTDAGASWKEITNPTGASSHHLNDVVSMSTSKVWIAAESGHLYASTDGGSTWTSASSGTSQHLVTVTFADSSHGFASGENRTFLRTTNGGSTWSSVTITNLPSTETIDDIAFLNSDDGILSSTTGYLLQTSDAGTTWSTVSSSGSPVLVDLNYVSANERWGVGDNGVIYRYDSASPTKPTNFDVSGNNDAVTDTTPSFTWTASSDSETAINYYSLKMDSGSSTNIGNTTATTYTTPLSNGSHTAYLYAVDRGGNTSSAASLTFTVDADSPSSDAPTVEKISPRTAIKNETVTFTALVSDDGSVDDCDLYVDTENTKNMTLKGDIAYATQSFSSTGSHSLYARCTDDEGNKTSGNSVTVKISKTSSYASAGDLIKIGCSGDVEVNDPCTAVYYYGVDGKRHAFPNESIYKSWYTDFDDLVILSSSAMGDISLGDNVIYRPGTQLVKFLGSTVYAIGYGGVLAPIANEEIAEAIFGSHWTSSIQTISDVFFGDYRMGSMIESSSGFSPSAVKSASSSINLTL